MELWSNIFLANPDTADWATCTVSLDLWRRTTDENPSARLIGQISCGDKHVFAALGTPSHEVGPNMIFMPRWLIDHLGVDGVGETVAIEWRMQESFPEATRIVLRPHDSAFYHADAKEELERALTRLGVLRQGDTLVIPLECLGGYEIAFDVMITEPANIVLAQGDEVVMEFEEALDAVPVPVPAPVPMGAMIPQAEEEPGQKLSEESARLMPDGRRWNPWRDGPWEG